MHIAYLTPEYPHPRLGTIGGLGTSIKNLVGALVQQKHTITLFVYGQQEDAVFTENGIHIHSIKKTSYKLGGFYFYRKKIETYVKANSGSIDVLEAPDWTGITAFMKFKMPLVIRIHGSDAYFCRLDKRKQKFKNYMFEKLALRKADGYITPSLFAGEETVKIFGLDKNKFEVIPHGIQLDLFNNHTPLVYKEKSLLYLGTLIRKKGVLELAKIFSELVKREPEARLVLVGNDSADVLTGSPSTYTLMQSIFSKEAQSKVEFIGRIPYEEVQAYVKEAHACVFPSFAETFGMVTVESMALKKAVVNTNIGWAQDLIVHGKDGFMHHPEEIQDYVNTILQLFQDQTLVKGIANEARKTVENKFDIHKIAHKNISFYKNLCSNEV